MIWRLILVVPLLWALGLLLFALSFGEPLDPGLRTDAIVVPTGSAGRIDRGLAVLAHGSAQRMLVTGTDPEVRPVELAAEYKVPERLFECCIDLGHEAVDTRSNASETAAWVRARGYRSVRVVTSDWHMPRARMELRHALGDEVELRGDPVPSNTRLEMLVREYNKFLVRRVALWLGYDR